MNYDISESVEAMARHIFAVCGAEDDYCVQDVGSSSIVFGSVNRIRLGKYGWKAFEDHCTSEFYTSFQQKYGRNRT
jgi:hypothetical protein